VSGVFVRPPRGQATSNSRARGKPLRGGETPSRPRRPELAADRHRRERTLHGWLPVVHPRGVRTHPRVARRTVGHLIAARRRAAVPTGVPQLVALGPRRARRRAPRANHVDRGGNPQNASRLPPLRAAALAAVPPPVPWAIVSEQQAHKLARLLGASSGPPTKSAHLRGARRASTRDPARPAHRQPVTGRRRRTVALGQKLSAPRTAPDHRSSLVLRRGLNAACGVRQRLTR